MILRDKVAARNGGRHFRDVSHLARQVAGHEVHVIGQVLPRAAHAGHLRLTAQLSFRADFARHARHFARERVQLVHHRVDRVLQLENFALHVHRDLAREVASRHGRGHFGDVAHLSCQIAGHRVHGVRQVLPGSGNARHVGLTAKPAFAADFARHARHFSGERVQLVHHRVDGFFQQQNFTADVHGDFLGEVAARDGRRHFGDVPHLARQVAGHRVHGVCEVFPSAADAGHLRLAAQLSVGAHFASHARHFGRERSQLVHHRVERVFQFENFALHVHRDLARQVASRHRRGHFGDVAHLTGQVAGHEVHVVGQVLPRAANARHFGLAAEFSFGTDFARHTGYFSGECVQLVHHRVNRVLQLENFALHVHRDLA